MTDRFWIIIACISTSIFVGIATVGVLYLSDRITHGTVEANFVVTQEAARASQENHALVVEANRQLKENAKHIAIIEKLVSEQKRCKEAHGHDGKD